MSDKKIHHRLDLRGKVCPDSTLAPCLAVDRMAVGEVLEVITDFYPARQTIPKLMEERGHLCELVGGNKPVFRFLIKKR